MDPLQLLADLEGLRDKIPGPLQADFEDLIASIRNIYEMSIKFVTPSQPVHDGKQSLVYHQANIDILHKHLNTSLTSFQVDYTGEGSDAYHATAATSAQNLQLISDHLANSSQLHATMVMNFDLATEAKIALVSLLVGLGITLGVLIVSAGTTAPVTVPAAVLEAAGGTISIGLLTEAEAAALAAVMGLAWAALPDALLAGLLATGAAELLSNLTLHPPTLIDGNTYIYTDTPLHNGPIINQARAHQSDLPSGGQVPYKPPKGAKGDASKAWDKEKNGFRDADGNVWEWDRLHNDHWDVQHPDGSYTNVYPDGQIGQGGYKHGK